jgi:hypothetical protein
MGNEILAVIENDSLRMGCLHLRGKVYGAVAAGCVGDMIERRLKRVGRLIIVASSVLPSANKAVYATLIVASVLLLVLRLLGRAARNHRHF